MLLVQQILRRVSECFLMKPQSTLFLTVSCTPQNVRTYLNWCLSNYPIFNILTKVKNQKHFYMESRTLSKIDNLKFLFFGHSKISYYKQKDLKLPASGTPICDDFIKHLNFQVFYVEKVHYKLILAFDLIHVHSDRIRQNPDLE